MRAQKCSIQAFAWALHCKRSVWESRIQSGHVGRGSPGLYFSDTSQGSSSPPSTIVGAFVVQRACYDIASHLRVAPRLSLHAGSTRSGRWIRHGGRDTRAGGSRDVLSGEIERRCQDADDEAGVRGRERVGERVGIWLQRKRCRAADPDGRNLRLRKDKAPIGGDLSGRGDHLRDLVDAGLAAHLDRLLGRDGCGEPEKDGERGKRPNKLHHRGGGCQRRRLSPIHPVWCSTTRRTVAVAAGPRAQVTCLGLRVLRHLEGAYCGTAPSRQGAGRAPSVPDRQPGRPD